MIMPRIPATASVAFVILQRWTCDNLESCVHLLSKQEMKSCRQSLSNDLEVPFTGVRSTLLNMYNLGYSIILSCLAVQSFHTSFLELSYIYINKIKIQTQLLIF